jgi:hypothetical protein
MTFCGLGEISFVFDSQRFLIGTGFLESCARQIGCQFGSGGTVSNVWSAQHFREWTCPICWEEYKKFRKSKKRHFFKSGNFDKNNDNSMEKLLSTSDLF